jgi:hypothetical protein
MKENNVCADLAFKRSIGTEYRYLGRSHRLPRGCTIGCSMFFPDMFLVAGAFAVAQIKTTHFSFF